MSGYTLHTGYMSPDIAHALWQFGYVCVCTSVCARVFGAEYRETSWR